MPNFQDRLRGTRLALYIRRADRPPERKVATVPHKGHDSLCALHESTSRPATWFEFVDDDALIAFKQPLLRALSQPVAVGELVGGERDGTLVVIPTAPDEDESRPRFTPGRVVNAFVAD
jgi:hypothetical protein